MRACTAAGSSSLRAAAQCSTHPYLRQEERMMEIRHSGTKWVAAQVQSFCIHKTSSDWSSVCDLLSRFYFMGAHLVCMMLGQFKIDGFSLDLSKKKVKIVYFSVIKLLNLTRLMVRWRNPILSVVETSI